MRRWPWVRNVHSDADQERAERQQRDEYDAAVRRIIEAPSWNCPTPRYPAAPLMTPWQEARSRQDGHW